MSDYPVAEALASLRAYQEEMDARIERAERELSEVKLVRNRVAAAVRALDPPPPKEKPTPAPKNPATKVAEEALDEMTRWLQDPRNVMPGEEVWVAKLVDDPTFTVMSSDSGVRNAVNELHDRGILVLDRVAQGGRRIYKVVTE